VKVACDPVFEGQRIMVQNAHGEQRVPGAHAKGEAVRPARDERERQYLACLSAYFNVQLLTRSCHVEHLEAPCQLTTTLSPTYRRHGALT
jgi:hypothetical protein